MPTLPIPAPSRLEWFANLTNAKTRAAYKQDIADFTAFVGIARPEELGFREQRNRKPG